MLVLAFVSDLPHIAYISSFSLLLDYAALNVSGLKILKGGARLATGVGLLTCLVLMASLPKFSWTAGAAVVVAGALYHALDRGRRRERSGRVEGAD